jgi:tryptophan-rich sensory protein
MKRLVGMLGFAGAVTAVALVGAGSNRRGMGWYRRLEKPPFQPPEWLFAPVWTALYATLAGSAYRIWRRPPSRARSRALAWWTANLVLNGSWSPIFFGRREPAAALAVIGGMTASLVAYLGNARRVDRPAAWMMAPYLGWTAFAGVLNGEIVRRN